jgi:hypothetical protein
MLSVAILSAVAAWPLQVRAQAAAPAGAASAPERTVRQEFGVPMQAAQTLLAEGKSSEALAKLREAEAIANRTPWETWVLERTRATVAQRMGDRALLVTSLEAAIETGQADSAEETGLVEALVGAASRSNDHPRVLRWSERYAALKGPNDAVGLLRIQSLADTGQDAEAQRLLAARVQAADQAGRATPESHLRLLLSLQTKASDANASGETLKRLAMSFPRPEYWADLVSRASREPQLSERALLQLYRLLRVTGNLRAADYRYEMAQIAFRVGQPGEALAVMDEGYAAGQMGGSNPNAAEHDKFRAQVRQLALADKADRAAAEVAARKAADGNALASLGWSTVASLSAQPAPAEVQPGLALIEQGVAKGGLKRPAETRLNLAMAQLAAGQREAAQGTLSALGGSAAGEGLAVPARVWGWFAQAPAMLPSRQ